MPCDTAREKYFKEKQMKSEIGTPLSLVFGFLLETDFEVMILVHVMYLKSVRTLTNGKGKLT